ncbi:MAG: TonB-dependent receptor [Myxococcales bacterium]|nr:TonB-dependent receptor [Myxococcales bacterium]MCB9642561.1 TonB-dependent receptor [Myxococcales bacterium]
MHNPNQEERPHPLQDALLQRTSSQGQVSNHKHTPTNQSLQEAHTHTHPSRFLPRFVPWLLSLSLIWAESTTFAAPPTSRPATSTQTQPPRKTKRKKTTPPASNTHQTDIIVVTGARGERRLKDTVNSVEVITRKQLEQTSAASLADVLQTHSGLQLSFDQGGGVGIRIQGLDAKYVLILIDGERLSGRVRGVIDLQRFPLERVERVEIVKGPSSALYGSDALGGVINIITRRSKKPLEFGGDLRYGYGGGHMLDLTGYFGMKRKKWDLQLSLGWHRYDAYQLADRDPLMSTSGSSNEILQIEGRASYNFSRKLRLSLRGHYLYQDRAGIDASATGAVFDRKNRTETTSVTLSTDSKFAGPTRLKSSLHFTFFRDQFLYDQQNSDLLDIYEETFDWLLQGNVQMDRAFGTQHILTIGLEGLYENLRADRIKDSFAHRGRGAIYAQYEWLPLENAPRLSVVPGLRFELDSQFGYAINPKLAVRFDPTPGLVLRASYGRAFRAPTFKELFLVFENSSVGYVVEGNPNLAPEYANGFQLGVEWQAVPWLWMSVQGYYNLIDNLIVEQVITNPSQPGTFRVQYANIASATTRGLEAVVRIAPIRLFSLEGGYTLTDTIDHANNRPLALRALHRGHVQMVLQDPWISLKLTVRGVFVGERFAFLDTNGDGKDDTIPIDPYVLLHARISRSFFHGRLEVFGAVQNILNAGNHQWLPIRPRTFFLGVRGRY